MDEIDRPAVGQLPSPRAPFNLDNRPELSEDTEPLDEVDRPSVTMDPERFLAQIVDDKNESEKGIEINTDFNHENMNIETQIANDEIIHIESSDGPPVQPIGNVDGPFNQMFRRHSPIIQQRTERTDKEGITSKHVTLYPKEPDSKVSGKIKHEVNSEYFYNINSFPRGKLTLINVKYFQKSSGMGEYPRHGTDKDAEGLCSLFLDLGFIVDRYDNPSKREILSILKGAANEDYSKLSCCACAMLSHGEEGIIYGTDGYVKIKEITKLFRSRSLAGKPKFFLFQACQGSEYMNPLDSVDGPGRHLIDEPEISLTLPSEADFLYAYSTVPGFYSWRNSRRGSWFMEAVVSTFRESAHKMDVVRMLTRVNAIVAHRKSRTDDVVTDDKRQIASIITQMRKEFFLFPPYGPLPKEGS